MKKDKDGVSLTSVSQTDEEIETIVRGLKLKTANKIDELCMRRDKAIRSLLKSLGHLSREQQFSIITSFMSIDDLEHLAKFQDRGGPCEEG